MIPAFGSYPPHPLHVILPKTCILQQPWYLQGFDLVGWLAPSRIVPELPNRS